MKAALQTALRNGAANPMAYAAAVMNRGQSAKDAAGYVGAGEDPVARSTRLAKIDRQRAEAKKAQQDADALALQVETWWGTLSKEEQTRIGARTYASRLIAYSARK